MADNTEIEEEELDTPIGNVPPPARSILLQAIIDEDGIVTGAVSSNEVQPDSLVVSSEETWTDLRDNPGRRRLVGDQFEAFEPPAPPVTGDVVNAERLRRIVAGKVVDGVHVTGTDEDARNLTNLALAAQLRLAAGDMSTVTVYRDGDNFDHELTPLQVMSLWQQSSAYVSALYAASWALKALDPIPADFADDRYWPQG
jgi:hypothetical protein